MISFLFAHLTCFRQESAIKAAEDAHYFNELKPPSDDPGFPDYPPEVSVSCN